MSKQELTPFIYPHNLHNRVKLIPQFPEKPILAGGMSESTYIQAVYGDVDPEELYVKKVKRPAGGIGPHFDIHTDLVNPDYPFVATYNVRGRATLRATVLSDELKDYYDSRYLVPTEDAKAARRHIGALALMDTDAEVYEGAISPHTGLIIPQIVGVSPLVHDIEPLDRPPRPIIRTSGLLAPIDAPAGEFMKYIVPRTTNRAINAVVNEGYTSLTESNRIRAEEQRRKEEAIRENKAANEAMRRNRRRGRGRHYPGGTLLD